MPGIRKSKKQKADVEEEDEETVEEETEEEDSEEESDDDEDEKPSKKKKKDVDTSALKELMEKYDARDTKLQEAKKAVDEAMASRSKIVKKISALIEPKKKFKYQGRVLSISHRGDSWFFRGPRKESEEDMPEVD